MSHREAIRSFFKNTKESIIGFTTLGNYQFPANNQLFCGLTRKHKI